MTIKKIPESELDIMKVIWMSTLPVSSKQIVKVMEEKKGWKNTTVLTLLSRLVKKKFINSKNEKRINYYTPIITEREYLGFETKKFFQKFHSNSLKSFINTLHENNDITDDDLDKLDKWIKNR
ncbi:BlaI/MecI/CopY family transcriptional regulator [Clostridium sp. JS66]|uniref:BlaI/MecI/CopY family transcriptional regulator n=1 Tax=Clostridium sp. JS66 TaxID=3064705 RepID=UPI00298E6128|nr:BlaI/MecI/CopY family transcriptional regulator [Clostridium sp. JS66]WPC40081.1 BlaI/MecI/CopY family transcriptional regulator [Clostridium sp. JS66]